MAKSFMKEKKRFSLVNFLLKINRLGWFDIYFQSILIVATTKG
jgi:hypothetical protein